MSTEDETPYVPGSQAGPITFHAEAKEIMRITSDRRFVPGPGLSEDEATQRMARALTDIMDRTDTRLKRALRLLDRLTEGRYDSDAHTEITLGALREECAAAGVTW